MSIKANCPFTQALADLEWAATCIGYAKNQNERENHQKNLKAAKADLIRAHNAQLEEVERDLYLRIGAVERALETVRKELEEEQLSHCHTRYTLEDITERLETAEKQIADAKTMFARLMVAPSHDGTVADMIAQLYNQCFLPQIENSVKMMKALETFVKIGSHRWRALPADSPEKKVIAEAIAILDSQ
jgi:hypothetical protein